jgi:hypothetical protein
MSFGAAARLGMKRTMLQPRMKKLGLSRRSWCRYLGVCRYFSTTASAPHRFSSED